MMGHRDGQMLMVLLDMEELIPRNHLLRKIDDWHLSTSYIIWRNHFIQTRAGLP